MRVVCSSRVWIVSALALLAAGPVAGRSFGTPSVHMVTWFPQHDVQIEMIPRRPHAGEEVTFAFTVTERATKAPLSGPLTVEVVREGLFGRVTQVVPRVDVRHDAGYPGEYTVRATPPASGLYQVRVASTAAGPSADARIGFGVWPSGFNRWVAVPLSVLALLSAFAVRRASRVAPSSA